MADIQSATPLRLGEEKKKEERKKEPLPVYSGG